MGKEERKAKEDGGADTISNTNTNTNTNSNSVKPTLLLKKSSDVALCQSVDV